MEPQSGIIIVRNRPAAGRPPDYISVWGTVSQLSLIRASPNKDLWHPKVFWDTIVFWDTQILDQFFLFQLSPGQMMHGQMYPWQIYCVTDNLILEFGEDLISRRRDTGSQTLRWSVCRLASRPVPDNNNTTLWPNLQVDLQAGTQPKLSSKLGRVWQ